MLSSIIAFILSVGLGPFRFFVFFVMIKAQFSFYLSFLSLLLLSTIFWHSISGQADSVVVTTEYPTFSFHIFPTTRCFPQRIHGLLYVLFILNFALKFSVSPESILVGEIIFVLINRMSHNDSNLISF